MSRGRRGGGRDRVSRSSVSTAMIRETPWEMAVISAAMPTPPRPTIMMLSCGRGRAALSTAPPPVSTAQPRTAATSAGMSSSTGTAEARSTTAWVAKPETPRWWWMGSPSRLRSRDPCSRVPVVVALGPCRAGQPAVLGAVRAVLAAGQEGHDHALAGLQVRDAGTDRHDAARGLVAQQHGYRPDPVAVDDAQVRVADSGGLHPDKDLGGPGSRQFQLGDADRPGLREGAGAADFLKYCTGDLHRSSFAAWSGLSER